MIRLIRKGLMFGNLIPVDSPILIDRYNKALHQLTGRNTALTDFHIDLSGFSPEIADELGDQRYLNHNGCNRQFILLTPEQKSAPLLGAEFSVNRDILRSFIAANEMAIGRLCARDAIAGELENSVFEIPDIDRLLDLRDIEILADTTEGLIEKARKLEAAIQTFEGEPDSWADDDLLQSIVSLARQAGDIKRHPVRLANTTFATPDYWTSHFGGLYVFASLEDPLIIARDGTALEGLSRARGFTLEDRKFIAGFLNGQKLVEPLTDIEPEKALRIISQKRDFILIGAASDAGIFEGGADRHHLKAMIYQLGDKLPAAYRALGEVADWLEGRGKLPTLDADHPAYFYLLRGASGPKKDLVNMLLSELCPRDVQKMFIFHKELFYRAYANWPDAKKEFVSDFLSRSYQMNKEKVIEDLFGSSGAQEELV